MRRTCTIEGCDRFNHAKGYCRKHYTEFCKRDNSVYIKPKAENEIIINDDTARLIICNRQGAPINETIIDVVDVDQVKKHRWYMHGKGYVQAQDVGMLHRFLLKPEYGEIIDHINKDKLDNRKSNLRIATLSENGYNSKLPVNNTSGIKGVTYHKQSDGWDSFLEKDGIATRKLFREFDDAVEHRQMLETSEPTFFNFGGI